jgi:hypothetical protein
MTAPQSLLQAAFNRLSARLGHRLLDSAAQLAELAQQAPGQFQQEWSVFWEEVELEAQRLERGGPFASSNKNDPGASGSGSPWTSAGPKDPPPSPSDPQDLIDALRARVAHLTQWLEQDPGRS